MQPAALPPLPVHPASPLAYAPPAGLPVGHEPIRKRSVGPVLLAAAAAFVVVTGGVVAIGNLARDSSTVAGQTGAPAVSTSDRIAGWRDGGGLSRMQAIQDDLASIGDAGARTDPDDMNTACRSLQRDIAAAQAYDPVPDAQVQSSWAGALTHGARAATYCIAGTEQLDADMLNRSADELTEMGRDLDDGAARLGAIA
ncbi:hypothetical protein [Pseudonocardia endophytica]|uniref:Uncharacterized protein n=1 Tax=Pseudonocardia endophytica TaxID=401976 RepID=A0A4R1HJH3_PSEEN|nr:hypothetical protein [Pseudonocardia endophytica]TCK20400.1 hypothetical protein EV378_4359 [Pseudonocardia endophytica]